MTALLITLLITMFLPFLAKAPLVVAMNKQPGGYDNRNPRAQQRALEGFGERANAAHYNSFEALGIYLGAIVVTVAAGGVDSVTIILGWIFVLSRVFYLLCYWVDKSSLRSLIWLAGIIAAFTMAIRALIIA
ncbi:MAG: MAPEG family protein [Idiomarina sp.]|nr:MAPEG family protein [Idiomarina sp.]